MRGDVGMTTAFSKNQFLLKNILKIDSLGGLCAGIFVLSLRRWISEFYGASSDLVLFVGIVNLAYGLFGLFNLAVAHRKILFVALICGNFFWAICCFGFVVFHFGSLGGFAALHGLFEGAFVWALAFYERKHFHEILMENKFG
jgi:hypothetical protein